jgi:formate transporter
VIDSPAPAFDALPPAAIARKAEEVGVGKARMSALDTLVLSVLAGAFIGLGAIFSVTVVAGTGGLPFGVVRLLAGVAFSLGLILVVIAGAELFTGNNLVVMAWASRRVSTLHLGRNWLLVYVGNLVGALGTVALVVVAKQYTFGGGAVGETVLRIGETKSSLGFVQALVLGALCNALVCLAVWLAYGARSTTDKVVAIVAPITAFVACGFEHSIANMTFLPLALLVKRDHVFVASLDTPPDTGDLTLRNVVFGNLLPVTLGNIIGGALMVGAVYWLVYLRNDRAAPG